MGKQGFLNTNVGFFKRRKMEKYLLNKDVGCYLQVDKVLKSYLDGSLVEILERYSFSNKEFFIDFYKKEYYVDIYFDYSKKHIYMHFDYDEYGYCVYDSYASPEEIEKLEIISKYQDGFNFEKLVEKLYSEIKQGI